MALDTAAERRAASLLQGLSLGVTPGALGASWRTTVAWGYYVTADTPTPADPGPGLRLNWRRAPRRTAFFRR